MVNPVSPYYPSAPSGYNPAYMGPSSGYIPNFADFWNMATYFMGAQHGQIKPIAGGFHVPYGTDPIQGVLSDLENPYLAGSRGFAYRTDEEALSSNLTSIVNNTLASLHLNLTDKQRETVRKAADMIAIYGPSALNMAEQLIAKDGDASTARSIIGYLRSGIDAMYGPGGPRTPMYSVLTSLGENVPLEQKDALFMHMMHQMGPVDGVLPGGFNYRQSASILSAAASMGYNALNAIDTDIAKELAAQDMASLDLSSDPERLKLLAEHRASQQFGKLSDASTFSQSLYQQINSKGDAGLFGASNQFSQFLDIRNRLSNIEGFDTSTINTFTDLINQRKQLQELSKNAKSGSERQKYLNNIITDINAIEKNVKEDYRGVNIDQELQGARQLQRKSTRRAVEQAGIYSNNSRKQKEFVRAMVLRDELSSYKDINLDYLAQDAVDENGNVIEGKKNWQVRAEKSNKELRDALTRYYGGGLHEAYTGALEELQGTNQEKLLKKFQAFQAMDTEAQKRALETDEDLKFINDNFTARYQAQQVSKNTNRLLRSTTTLKAALATNGTPIENDNQIMAFINKITYGGVANMSEEELAHTVEQISAGMIASGASGNDVMQMAGRGAEAALAVGGNAQVGAVQGINAGLSAREIAKEKHMDINMAQELGARAAGRSTKSIVAQAYNSIGSFLNNRDVDLTGNPYADIIRKIQHNETLTQDEIDTIYRESSEIMTSIGMTSDQQVSYMNRLYRNGARAVAATRAGTQFMMNSTPMRDIMKDNIRTRLLNETNLNEESRNKISSAIVNAMSELPSLDLLTDTDHPDKYYNWLVSQVKKTDPEAAKELEKLKDNPETVQLVGMNALSEGANYNGTDEQQTLDSMRAGSNIGERMKNRDLVSAMKKTMPDINQSVWQNVSSALTEGTFEGMMKSMVTAVSDANLSPEAQRKLFHAVAAKTILDQKDAGKAGLGEKDTIRARETLYKLYAGARNDPETVALLHRWLANPEDVANFSTEEFKKYQTAIKEAEKLGFNNEELKHLTTQLNLAEGNIAKKFNESKTVTVSRGKGEKEVVPPAEPDSTTVTPPAEPSPTSISSTGGTPKTTTPKPGEPAEGETESEKSTVAKNGQLGTPGNPMVVEIKGLVAGGKPLPVDTV